MSICQGDEMTDWTPMGSLAFGGLWLSHPEYRVR
jgi:hypothetical protein